MTCASEHFLTLDSNDVTFNRSNLLSKQPPPHLFSYKPPYSQGPLKSFRLVGDTCFSNVFSSRLIKGQRMEVGHFPPPVPLISFLNLCYLVTFKLLTPYLLLTF